MSVGDFKEILNAPEILFFLPTVNYVYLFATTDFPQEFTLSFAAIVSSAIVYNILSGVPVSKAKEVRLGVSVLLGISGTAWLLLLLHSMFRLYKSFDQASVIHEILFFITIVFGVVAITNLILIWYEDKYRTIF